MTEARKVLDEIRRLRDEGRGEVALSKLTEALQDSDSPDPDLLLEQADLLISRNSAERAEQTLERVENLDLNGPQETKLLILQGGAARLRGEIGEARELLESAIDRAESGGWDDLLLMALLDLGNAELHARRGSQAREHLETALELAEQYDETVARARALLQLANLEGAAENFQQAIEYAEESHELYSELGYATQAERAQFTLGKMLRGAGEPERAEQVLRKALETTRELDLVFDSAVVSQQLALVLFDQGENEPAEAFLDAAMQKYRDLGMEERAEVVEEALKELAEQRHGEEGPSQEEFGTPES